jgi:hypothetical protein
MEPAVSAPADMPEALRKSLLDMFTSDHPFKKIDWIIFYPI